ncbi:hypothetical protein ACFFKH_09510 [Micromonospora marina]|uniref:Uncharacterized protein n=1 Tax=Micromonospora marina TaxID=307120 RepID=A0A1C4XCH9_9ACTN|nr:hypothetical protein [Micromonospora marina]SCF06057.1 hypothetical protein GA0070215_10747 [Micromonospora marina]
MQPARIAVRVSRSLGVDLTDGDSLDAALAHADAVVDTTNCTATGRDEAVAYFVPVYRRPPSTSGSPGRYSLAPPSTEHLGPGHGCHRLLSRDGVLLREL